MRFLYLILCLVFALPLAAQVSEGESWLDEMGKPGANYYSICEKAERYFSAREATKGDGRKAFARWKHFWGSRILSDGSFPSEKMIEAARKQKELLRSKTSGKKSSSLQNPASFTFFGPNVVPSNGGGAGRLNCVAFDPTNTSTVWVGAAAGGVWKSTNDGATWTTNTDQLVSMGISAIAINPANTNIMYLGTGDRDGRDTYGAGVLKSTNGGASWNSTGLSQSTQSYNSIVSRILIQPTTPDIVVAATYNGMHRTTNGGTTWSQVLSGTIMDLVAMPNSPNILYATSGVSSGAKVYRSLDFGTTWSELTTGITLSQVYRIALGVSAANPAVVYALCSRGSTGGYAFHSVYRSLDSGNTWSSRSTTPNILDGSTTGSGTTGQGWYDLAIAVNPSNSDDVWVGGVNVWRSTNGGTSWTIRGYWQTGFSTPYLHADQHDFVFKPGTSELYSGNDGGLFKTTNNGTSWVDLSNGLAITQFYKISSSQSNSTKIIGGAQDNGSNISNAGAWAQTYGGDGMDNEIDYSNDVFMYCSWQYGNLLRTTNSGTSWSSASPTGEAGNGAWVTPLLIDPITPTTVYCAYRSVYRSTNRGANWSSIGTNVLSSGTDADFLAICKTNSAYMAVGNSNQLFKTTNGGTSWTNIVGALPGSISDIKIHPTGPDTMWVSIEGWSATGRVYKTTNGGSSWTNITGSIPTVPVNCILYEGNSVGGLYVGTDIGVFYTNNTMSDWITYDDGLPNTIVSDLELYTPLNKLRVGSFGRGIWQGNPYSVATATPSFTASATTICQNDSITFTDNSTGTITSRSWTFAGGVPSTSTASSVAVMYPTSGLYDVTLVINGAFGTQTLTRQQYVNVGARPQFNYVASKTRACVGDSIVLVAPTGYTSYVWNNNSTSRTVVLKDAGVYAMRVVATGTNGCSGASQQDTFRIVPTPTATITVQGNKSQVCEGDSAILDAGAGFTQYIWSNGASGRFATVKTSTSVTVTVIDSSGCTTESPAKSITVRAKPQATITALGATTFCSGDSVVLQAPSGAGYQYTWSTGASTRSIVVRTSGTINLIVTDSAGCSSSANPLAVTVTAIAKPKISVKVGALSFCNGDSVTLDAGSGYSSYRWSTGDTTQTIVVRSSKTVAVQCTNTQGCASTSDSVNTLMRETLKPSVVAVGGVFTACQGDTIVLDAGAGYSSYLWSSGATSRFFSCTTNTTATVQVTLASGCKGASDSVTVRFFAKPTTPVITVHGDTLKSTEAPFYQWKRNGVVIAGATQSSLIRTESGEYTVTVTNAQGCSTTSAGINVTVGVEESNSRTMLLYPNPSTESISIYINDSSTEKLEIVLYNANGVEQSRFLSTTAQRIITIPTHALPSGAYMVRCISKGIVTMSSSFVKH